jgi:hypothetical protein
MSATFTLLVVTLMATELHKTAAEKGAIAAARDIVAAVKGRKPEAILAHVAPGGIPCVDSVVERKKIEEALENRDSWYHAYFFDAVQFNQRFRDVATPVSLSEFVTKGERLSYLVQFQRFPNMPAFSSPCVSIHSRDIKGKQVLCFYYEQGGFWLRDGPNCG